MNKKILEVIIIITLCFSGFFTILFKCKLEESFKKCVELTDEDQCNKIFN